MEIKLTGATRLNVIIGDPIAQVKSPGGMTRGLLARGCESIVVPVQVAPDDLADFLSIAKRLKNLDAIIVTVPHKFACYKHCATATGRSDFLGAVNIMRRGPNGRWHGDSMDGIGFVGAVRGKGYEPKGKRALLVGAGGAGSAIALALVDAGVRELAIHDTDMARRDNLIARLKSKTRCSVIVGTSDPSGFDLVGNASQAGMNPGDPLPIDLSKLAPLTFVGCVITAPAVSPVVEAARKIGCPTSTGTEMYQAEQGPMIDFLLFVDREDAQ
jgi:shikimate dehydrogenase